MSEVHCAALLNFVTTASLGARPCKRPCHRHSWPCRPSVGQLLLRVEDQSGRSAAQHLNMKSVGLAATLSLFSYFANSKNEPKTQRYCDSAAILTVWLIEQSLGIEKCYECKSGASEFSGASVVLKLWHQALRHGSCPALDPMTLLSRKCAKSKEQRRSLAKTLLVARCI